jgi:aromatic-amino-acid transaminase
MTMSLFASVEPYAGDPILSLNEAYLADERPGKVNLGIGVYTDEAGRIPVLESVRTAGERLGFGPRSYLPMEGHAAYRAGVQRLVFGPDHPALREGRVATVQTVGGTGGVGLAADLLAKVAAGRRVYVSDPSWENHHGLFQRAGFQTSTYPYWNAAERALDMRGLASALEGAQAGSVVVVQPVCHNPTGLDLDQAQEAELTELLLARGHVVVFDMAYQGFGTDLDEDAGFVRRFAARGSCLVVNSFSKNFSLYGERCGALSVVCAGRDEAERVLGQLKLAVRRSYSSPPMTGGLLVATVLGSDELRAQWEGEVAAMRQRMLDMRVRLAEAIQARSNEADAGFLTRQRGMFSYTGLSAEEVEAMRVRAGIYLVGSGRMCVAGLTAANVERVAESFISVQAVVNSGS